MGNNVGGDAVADDVQQQQQQHKDIRDSSSSGIIYHAGGRFRHFETKTALQPQRSSNKKDILTTKTTLPSVVEQEEEIEKEEEEEEEDRKEIAENNEDMISTTQTTKPTSHEDEKPFSAYDCNNSTATGVSGTTDAAAAASTAASVTGMAASASNDGSGSGSVPSSDDLGGDSAGVVGGAVTFPTRQRSGTTAFLGPRKPRLLINRQQNHHLPPSFLPVRSINRRRTHLVVNEGHDDIMDRDNSMTMTNIVQLEKSPPTASLLLVENSDKVAASNGQHLITRSDETQKRIYQQQEQTQEQQAQTKNNAVGGKAELAVGRVTILEAQRHDFDSDTAVVSDGQHYMVSDGQHYIKRSDETQKRTHQQLDQTQQQARIVNDAVDHRTEDVTVLTTNCPVVPLEVVVLSESDVLELEKTQIDQIDVSIGSDAISRGDCTIRRVWERKTSPQPHDFETRHNDHPHHRAKDETVLTRSCPVVQSEVVVALSESDVLELEKTQIDHIDVNIGSYVISRGDSTVRRVWERKAPLVRRTRYSSSFPLSLSGRKRHRSHDNGGRRRAHTPRKKRLRSHAARRESGHIQGKIKVGEMHQAVLPDRLPEKSFVGNMGNYDESASGDVLWNPSLADSVGVSDEDMEKFLHQGQQDLNTTMMRMESMHQGGYSIEQARTKFTALYQRRRSNPSIKLSDNETLEYKKLHPKLVRKKMDIRTASQLLDRRPEVVLVHYYRSVGPEEHKVSTSSMVKKTPRRSPRLRD